jgi:hypothetical protein
VNGTKSTNTHGECDLHTCPSAESNATESRVSGESWRGADDILAIVVAKSGEPRRSNVGAPGRRGRVHEARGGVFHSHYFAVVRYRCCPCNLGKISVRLGIRGLGHTKSMSRNGLFASFSSLVTVTVCRPCVRTFETNKVPKMASAENPSKVVATPSRVME